jgi:hypothetical protein
MHRQGRLREETGRARDTSIDGTGAGRECFVRRVMGTVSMAVIFASLVSAGPGSAQAMPIRHARALPVSSVAPQPSTVLLTAASASERRLSAQNDFQAIENREMPGLSTANWPTVAFVESPPGVDVTANVGSNDLKYTVTFYDFRSRAAATAFYKAPPGSMLSFLFGAQGYTSLSGRTGIPGRSRGVDLRSCVGEGTGVALFPNGQCSTGKESFSLGVGTITQVGPVVMMVGYVRDNARTKAAKSLELEHNAKIALSGVQLLRSIGIGSR